MEQIFVGTNYHPHDHGFEKIKVDVQNIKKAGFNVVRIGHLCWDSFEPQENIFEFNWFDEVIKLFEENSIEIIVDIPTRPAPIWLHKKFPTIGICNEDGILQRPVRRYMQDVGDPQFQKYAIRLAEKIVTRYHSKKGLLAFGLCNEVGAGFHSYSVTAERRFQQWLEKKYRTIDVLNKAWATQRWSRRVNNFEEVFFPVSTVVTGAPESFLDMKRFFSDELGEYLSKLQNTVKQISSTTLTTSNHWAEHPKIGFDYFKYYKDFVDIPALGFYPGINPEDKKSISGACMTSDHRIAETGKNIWGLEFQTGTTGGFAGPKGLTRMYCYLSLVYRNEMICAWTWDSMVAGEEQYIFGLLNHDGGKTYKLVEYEKFAKEIKALKEYNIFPRKIKPRVAVAYSFESNHLTKFAKDYYQTDSEQQISEIYDLLFKMNVDSNIVDLRCFDFGYDILIIPGIAIIDKVVEENIRSYVKSGGTVLMTAYSAKVNEYNQVFATPFPGGLTDVFGVEVSAFDRAYTSVPTINEGGVEKKNMHVKRSEVSVVYENQILNDDVDYYEILESTTANNYLDIKWEDNVFPGCTINEFGSGKAYYMAIPVEQFATKFILEQLFKEKEIWFHEEEAIVTRILGEGIQIFINTSKKNHEILIDKDTKGLLDNDNISDNILKLKPFDVQITIKENNLFKTK